MYRIFTQLSAWLAGLFEAQPAPDPLAGMSPGELADLPVHHPQPCAG